MARQARSQDTVDRVLAAAAVEFAAHGIRGGSVHTIAKRSGVSIGSIYHHFRDRDGVALALFQRQLDHLLVDVTTAFLNATTARRALDALVDAYVKWVRAHEEAARFLFFAGPAELNAQSREPLDGSKAKRLLPVFERIRGFVQAGWLRPLPVDVFEVVVVAPVAELSRRYVSGATHLFAEPGLQAVKDALWRSVACDPAQDGPPSS